MSISPKVLAPAAVGLVVGFGLLIAGLVAHDSILTTAGVSVLLSAAGQGAIGYQAPHPVPAQTTESSDHLLSAAAKKHLK